MARESTATTTPWANWGGKGRLWGWGGVQRHVRGSYGEMMGSYREVMGSYREMMGSYREVMGLGGAMERLWDLTGR